MNLRDQLRDILPTILPRNPAQAIKGTELIELVKYRLRQNYSDATLRYHFSIMSCDPSSPIAKVEQGQGYYLRSTTIHSINSARNLINDAPGLFGDDSMSADGQDAAILRANKFRAVFQRYCESEHRFPFIFEHSFSDENAASNRWKFPDATVLEWLVGEVDENGEFAIDPAQLDLRRSLASPPLRLTSVKLKLEIGYHSLREDLFQALSVADFANSAELVVAAPIADEQLVDDIRQFSLKYGVGVTTLGLDADALDDMPEPAAIQQLLPREFEAIQSLFKLRKISSSRIDPVLNWQCIDEASAESADFSTLSHWIAYALREAKALSIDNYREILEASGAQAEFDVD